MTATPPARPSDHAVTIVRSDAFLAARDELVDLYRLVFCAPPWNEPEYRAAAFADRLATDAVHSGFRAAFLRAGAVLAGFAYGFITGTPFPDHGCYASLRVRYGDEVALLSGAVEVVELAVRPAHRSAGAGRALLASVVADRPAWLLTHPRVDTAVGFYRRLGWHEHPATPDLVVFTNQARLGRQRGAGGAPGGVARS